MDLSKVTFDDFCRALVGCKNAEEVRSLVLSDYGIKLPRNGDRTAMLQAAYEAICKQKAPALEPEQAPAPAPLAAGAAGRYRVRVKEPNARTRIRAGIQFQRAWSTHDLSAEQHARISADPFLQVQPVPFLAEAEAT